MPKSYRVRGMTCDGCVRAVTRAVGRAAPGVTVEVDLARGRVTIDGATDEEAIGKAIEAAGFGFEGRDAS
jgi:copper chaperone